MKTTHSLCRTMVAIVLLSCVWLSCSDNDGGTPAANTDPVVTEAGTPTGTKVSSTIGADGGTLNSADGLLTLSVPAGAFSANTEVSIQPITNNAPLGLGLGYRLLPEGTTFNKPVTLTFHYNDGVLNGSLEDFLWIVTQAHNGTWNAMLKSKLDTNTKTVSIETTHFSDWVMGRFIELTLIPSSMALRVGSTMTLGITGFTKDKDFSEEDELAPLAPITGDGLDYLAPLTPIPPQEARLQDFRLTRWTLNGVTAPVSNKNGALKAAGGMNAAYTAPDKRPSPNIVAVTAELEGNNQEGRKFKYLLTSNITIIDSKYYLTVTYDGRQTFTYYQYGFDGQLPDQDSLTIANCGRNDNVVTFGGSTFYHDNMTDAFAISIENPAEGSRSLGCWYSDDESHDKDDATFTNGETGAVLGYIKRTPKPNDYCETEYTCGMFALVLTQYTAAASAEIAGRFYGKIYEDHDEFENSCTTPIEHTVEGEFKLIQVN